MVETARHPTILVGFGRMGKLHAEHALQLSDLRYIVDPVINEEDPFTKQIRETTKVAFVKTIEEVDPTGIKAIIVCCYAKDRKAYFEYAVKHRLAFFSEKPLCHNVTEGLEIVNLYRQPENADLPVMLGFQWRFDNILKKLIEAGSEAVTVHIFARDPWGPPAAYFNISGGTVVEFGVHAIDYFNAITRSDVQEISATGLKKYFGEEYVSEDISVVTFKTFKGNLGIITLGWHNKGGYEQRAEVFDLEKGIIKADDPEGLVTNDRGNPVPHFVRRYKQAFHDELKFFYENLVGRTGAEIAAHKGKYSSTVEGYKTMVWALLAQASQAKRNVIKIENPDDVFDLAKIKALAE